MEDSAVEKFRHFVFYCLAFGRLKMKYIGSPTFVASGNITETDIGRFYKFMIGPKHFVDF